MESSMTTAERPAPVAETAQQPEQNQQSADLQTTGQATSSGAIGSESPADAKSELYGGGTINGGENASESNASPAQEESAPESNTNESEANLTARTASETLSDIAAAGQSQEPEMSKNSPSPDTDNDISERKTSLSSSTSDIDTGDKVANTDGEPVEEGGKPWLNPNNP